MRMRPSWQASWSGGIRAVGARAGRVNKLVTAATAIMMAVALTVVAVVIASSGRQGAPVQQSGTAAGRPHRVPASATMARLINDAVAPARAAKAGPAPSASPLPEGKRPRGAVPAASKPPRLKLGGRPTQGTDRLRALRLPAVASAKGFSPRTSRVVPAGTSASRVMYQNADGSRTAMFYQEPVNYRLPDGSWARINTSLVPSGTVMSPSPSPSLSPSPSPSAAGSPPSAGVPADGWRERSAAEPETFAPFADGSPLVLLPLGGSESVGLGVAGAAHVAGVAQGAAVTYAGVRADADVRLAAGAGVVDEQLILHSASAPDSWVFPLRLNGLSARTGPGGIIEFTDSGSKIMAVMPSGLMTDSKIDPRSGTGAVSTGVSYTLTTADGQPAIRMTLDAAWLDAPSRVFPVTVDPSVSSYNSGGTTYVESPGSADYSGDSEIDVGTWDGGSNVAKSFLNFGGVSSALANDTVLGVRLGLFNSWSYSCSPRTVSVYPVTSSWSVTGAKSYPGPSTGRAVGSKSFATGWVPLGSTVSPCPSAWEGIDLNEAGTQLVNGWTHGTTPNDGLALGASSSDSYGWKKFTSDNATNGDPFLSVTYTPYGAKYDLASSHPVEQVWPNQNGELAIKVTNTGSATWTPTNGYELSYEAYSSVGKLVANHPVFTAMPSSVAPGASVTVDAKVDELPVGSYAVDFDMYANATSSSPVSFLSQGIAPFAVGLVIPQPPPVVTGVYPPTGYTSSTVTPELSTTAVSTTGTAITYQFSLACDPLPGSVCPASSLNSGVLSVPYWTPPTAMTWDEPYTWTVKATTNGVSTTVGPVSITPEVPQPAITSGLGGSSGQAFDPQSGNFTTSAADAAVAVAGPPLAIDRTYNSLDPRAAGAFGAGWSSELDAAVIPDNDGSGNVVVALPTGQQIRFGYNAATATYAPPMGSPDVLTYASGGTWTLMDSSGNQYEFTSAGQLEQVTDAQGLTQELTENSAGEVTTITDTASGRALTLTWSLPVSASYPHVASVTTGAPAPGQADLTWTYSYTGDDLTSVCAPTGGCTSYTYGTGSSYRSAVLDSAPRSYWQFGDAAGSTTAADEVDANLGTTDGTYSNVTLGAVGPLAGSSETAASFNGTSSYVSLPASLIADQSYVSVGLWFKAASSTTSGVLFGYQADPLTTSAGSSAARDPALYVGSNGKLYGELWNGSIDPMSSSVNVDDGNWHYAVLTGSGTSQSLWLDGTEIGTLSGQITANGMTNDTAGAGFWTGWPAEGVQEGPSLLNTPIGYFDGSISQAAVYPHPLGQPAIAEQDALALSASAELTQVTLPSGRVYQQAAYNTSEDRVTSYTDPDGGQWQIHAPLATGYKATSDSLGEATRYVTVANPAGYDEVYGYDAVNGGRPVSYSRGNGDAPETYGYDAAGFLNQVTDSDGNLVSFTNDIHGNMLSRTWYPVEPSSDTSSSVRQGPAAAAASSSCTVTGAACTAYYSYYYDAGNPLDPRNDELTQARDARSASATDNTYLTAYAYNAAGELTSATTPATSDFPSGRTASDLYSTASTAAYGGGTTPPGLLVSQSTPGGAVTACSYYSDGDLAQVTKPTGLRTVYTYDALGRALTSTAYSDAYPSGLTTTYSYNAVNEPLTVTYPGVANKVTGATHTLRDSYAYDGDGNLTSLAQSDLTGGDPARTTSYTYNDVGEVASVTDPAGATSGGSAPPQGASSANPAGATTGYTYDDSGNVATMVDADGNEYDYAYNEYNEVTQVTLNANSTSQSNPGGSSSLVLDAYAYDPAGLLATATDAMGRSTNYFYDSDDDVIATRELTSAGTGRQTGYSYDGAGNLTATDVSNVPVTEQTVTDYTYDAASRLTSQVVDPTPAGTSDSGYANRTTAYTYNADNHVTAATVTGAGGSSTTDYGYDTSGDLTSRTIQDGSTPSTTNWTYDELGLPTSVTSPDGNASGATAAAYTTNYAYDQAGGLAVATGPPVATQSYGSQSPVTTRPVTTDGYDTFGDQTQVQDADGNLTTTGYDGDGRVTSVTRPSYTPPGSTAPITAPTKYAYDGNGNLTSVIDPEGNTASYAHDTLGDVTSVTEPQLTGQSAAGVYAYTYDSDGEQLSATSPTGAETQATYDGFGDQITSTQDIAASSGTQYDTTSYAYDYLGDPLTATSPDGAVTTDTYDHLGELASTANAFGDTTSYAYNYAGDLAQVSNPDGTSQTYGYNPAGQQTSATSYGASAAAGALPPVLATQASGYDPAGNLTSVTDRDQVTTNYAYNAAGELTSLVAPVSASASDTTSYGYDPAGNQTSVTTGRGNTTWTTYNPWGLPESVIEPATAAAPAAAQRTWTTSYNADGQSASVTQPGGITQAYGYDQLGDLTSESGTGAAASTPAQSFGYNTSGQLTSASAPGGSDSFSYDGAGDLTATTGPSGNATFAYNADQLMTSRTDAAGTTSYGYDKADRLATATDPLTSATLTYGYNADSLPATVSYAKGAAAGPTQSYAYNGLQQLTGDTLTSAAGATIAAASYGYNADGDLTSQATTGYAGAGSSSYGYNQADQLTSATTGTAATGYGYDADGDLTQAGNTTYGYNAQDQLTSSTGSAGSTSYAYTPSGALSSITPPSGAAQDYTSNAYGQTATAPGGISYGYDALGRLATRTTSTATADFAYSGTGDTVASDGTTSYSYDPSGDLIGTRASGGTAASALTDVHGDVTGAFSPAASTTSLAASAAYSPYGAVTASAGTMPGLGYQGQYTDPSTSDTDMSARWYNPATGSFTSNDTITGSPIPDPGGIIPSPYGYADGNPLTGSDPSGHFCWKISCVTHDIGVAQCLTDWVCIIVASLNGATSVDGCDVDSCAPGGPAPCDIACGGPPILGLEPGWGSHSGDDEGGGGCGGACIGIGIGVGIGAVGACVDQPELCVPVPPPPPPPPPQDCYAGPDPGCHPPTAPRSLRDDQHESEKPRNVTKPADIPGNDTVVSPAETAQQYLEAMHEEISGIEAEAGENGAAPEASSTDTSPNGNPASDIGQPATPDASGPESGNPAAEGGSGSGGAGNPPPTTPAAPEPPDEGPGNITRIVVDNNGIRAVTSPANGPESLYQTSGPEFEQWQQSSLENIARGGTQENVGSSFEVGNKTVTVTGLPDAPLSGSAEGQAAVREPTGDYTAVSQPTVNPPSGTPFPGESQDLTGWQKTGIVAGAVAGLVYQLEPVFNILVWLYRHGHL
jgi:RHS repeat-associated protein